ncbi:phosphate ABC transporter permease PstA [Halapricum hydrolyticum]|uniref:Phosphate transport system permease protein PstA n=1 Tax=Halapricum hydrolyticum TaxID=2979991 RepID=A0AAE3LGQ8_9EURY|nr:phosphate ABC transporter permease PstA [Halapricum hydrolyticum]MCU4716486.1 phosphate ABC transporter permease PstA [Halapricum hydrolyticum]MCU4725909.1 phosphate ABC transporter permease PstA [Halapricum hydrolyticum]
MAAETPSWAQQAGQVSRLRGRAFEAICLASTSLALVSVMVLLLFVANDAFRPFEAEPALTFAIPVLPGLELFVVPVVLPAYLLVFGATLGLPVALTALYYYRRDDPAGEVAYATLGLPIVSLLVSAGVLVMFIEVLTVSELFATELALLVAVGAIYGHARLRPRKAVERLAIIIVAPVVALAGLPPAMFNDIVNGIAGLAGVGPVLTTRLFSVRELVLASPFLPVRWVMLLATVTLPVVAIFAPILARRRESREAGLALGGLSMIVAALGLVAAPALGVGSDVWIVVASVTVPPLAVYVEGVVRRREGMAGLAFPLVLIGGALAGWLLVQQVGFGMPDPWLDWGFLTNAHSRFSAEKTGIYPPLVGSVMMLFAIVILIFPVGVGAAIYLEEYAPSQGLAGKFVTLIEINIGNLAGVPSVVYGLLGLALFIRFLSMPVGAIIVGALAVGLLILPIVIISAQEAIRAVPDSHREASYGMGATRWQTIRDVVLPQAFPGILTGTILALGRAIGETAPLLMIGMPAIVRRAPDGFFATGSAMPRQIFRWSKEFDPLYRHGVLAAGVVTLLVVLLIMNGTAIILRNKFQREETA